jgi:GT2 family glycosyltransferase
MKILLAITTYNQLDYTKKLVSTLKTLTIPGLDIIFIDDVSKDGTQDFIKKCGYTLIERKEPKGLTWSWNIAYRKFKNENYDCFILSNNDVLLTDKSLTALINSTKQNTLVCPLSTKNGAGHNWQFQDVLKHYPNIKLDVNDPKNYKSVQDLLSHKIIKMQKFNGFLFAMSRKIIESEYNSENLFNPTLTNVHQEGDLQSRMKELPTACLGSFVFHYKGVSFPIKGIKNGKDIRQNLNLYHK